MRNVHRRRIDVPPQALGALLDRLGTDDDPLWPTPAWPPLRLDNGLTPGSAGGHGPIRYHVTEYEPSQRVRFTFDESLPIRGYHELRVENGLVHEAEGTATGWMLLAWPLAVRWLHDALIEDLFDRAERATTGRLANPARHGRWVRILRRLTAPKARAADLPGAATLLRDAALDRRPPDLADAWSVPIGPGMPTDPSAWARVIFHDPPPAVVALLRLRNVLVRLVGIAPGTQESFAAKAHTSTEHLLGSDDKHLDFRASVFVHSGTVTVSTLAWFHNGLGRLYLVPVRFGHPRVVRALLGRALRTLATHPGERAQAVPATEGTHH